MSTRDFAHDFADVGDAKLHYVTLDADGAGPSKPPAVLLHGWPETWYEWRHVMPVLAKSRQVIAPDLRGLGDSSRPLTGYDKRTVANDLWCLIHEHLGIERFHLVGHDWGGPTAFALAAAHAQAIASFALLDVVIPGDGGDFSQGGRRWHHAFHATPDLPEALVHGREDVYLSWFYREFSWRPDTFSTQTINEYLRTYTQPGSLRAGFNFYRALPQDVADNAALLATGFRLEMPALAMGGGCWESRGRGTEPEESLRRVARQVVRGLVVDDCGHFIPEEYPELVATELDRHFHDAD